MKDTPFLNKYKFNNIKETKVQQINYILSEFAITRINPPENDGGANLDIHKKHIKYQRIL